MEDNSKEWQYLTDAEISQLPDVKIQSEYRRKINRTVRTIINPLYMYAIKHGFDDSTFLKQETIHGMVTELKLYFAGKGMGREEEIDIILNSRRKK